MLILRFFYDKRHLCLLHIFLTNSRFPLINSDRQKKENGKRTPFLFDRLLIFLDLIHKYLYIIVLNNI